MLADDTHLLAELVTLLTALSPGLFILLDELSQFFVRRVICHDAGGPVLKYGPSEDWLNGIN